MRVQCRVSSLCSSCRPPDRFYKTQTQNLKVPNNWKNGVISTHPFAQLRDLHQDANEYICCVIKGSHSSQDMREGERKREMLTDNSTAQLSPLLTICQVLTPGLVFWVSVEYSFILSPSLLLQVVVCPGNECKQERL